MTKGRPKVAKIWTDEKLNQVKDLAHNNSMSEIGKILDTTKNADSSRHSYRKAFFFFLLLIVYLINLLLSF